MLLWLIAFKCFVGISWSKLNSFELRSLNMSDIFFLTSSYVLALRPSMSSLDNVDDSFSQWKQPFVQQALSQVAFDF